MAGTTISINEDMGQLTGILLNIAELERNTEYTRIGYCTKVDVGNTQDGKPFFRFNILDKGGHAIQARIFNVESVESKGLTANNLRNKVVKIRFELSSFNGVNSLTVHSIDQIPEKALSREEFIGELDGVQDNMKYIVDITSTICKKFPVTGSLINKYNLLAGIETITMPDMWAERKGGAVRFTAMLLKLVEASFNNDGEDDLMYAQAMVILSELFMYWKYAANYEETVLSLGDNINTILAKSDKYLDAVITKAQSMDDKVEYNLCKETKHLLKCYFGYTVPETYRTISIFNLRKALILKLRMQDEDSSMLAGTYKSIPNEDGSYKRLIKLN